jgi:hypothetical protein
MTALQENLNELLSERISKVRDAFVAELEDQGTKNGLQGQLADITDKTGTVAFRVNDFSAATRDVEYRKQSGLGAKKAARDIASTKSRTMSALADGKRINRIFGRGSEGDMISGAVSQPTIRFGSASVGVDLKKVISSVLGDM